MQTLQILNATHNQSSETPRALQRLNDFTGTLTALNDEYIDVATSYFAVHKLIPDDSSVQAEVDSALRELSGDDEEFYNDLVEAYLEKQIECESVIKSLRVYRANVTVAASKVFNDSGLTIQELHEVMVNDFRRVLRQFGGRELSYEYVSEPTMFHDLWKFEVEFA